MAKFTETESRKWLPGVRGGENGEFVFNGDSLFGKMKRVLEKGGGNGCMTSMYLIWLNSTL